MESEQPKPPVRRKRGPNRLPSAFKDSLMSAFDALQMHPKASLVQWGIENPTLFYNMVRDIAVATEKGRNSPDFGNVIQIVTGVPQGQAALNAAVDAEYTELDDGSDLV